MVKYSEVQKRIGKSEQNYKSNKRTILSSKPFYSTLLIRIERHFAFLFWSNREECLWEDKGVHSLIFQTQWSIICLRLLSNLQIESFTGHNFNFRLGFPLLLLENIGIGIVLELQGIALQSALNCIGILLPK